MGKLLAHVAVPFARSGTSVNTDIRALCRERLIRGGEVMAVVSHNRDTVLSLSHDVYVDYTEFCPRQDFRRWQILVDFAFGLLGLTRPYTSRLPIPAMRACATAGARIVVVHESHYAASALPRWRRHLPDAQLVLYVHVRFSRSYRPRELQRLLRAADDVVFVSAALREICGGDALDRVTKTHVLINGVDLPPPPPTPVERAPRRLFFAGLISPLKGPDAVVGAVEILRAQGRDVTARLAGRSQHGPDSPMTPFESDLQARAGALDGAVEFLGWLSPAEVLHEMRSTTLFCVPSVFDEPCGLVALEAMSVGAAIVSSRRGGLPEVLGNAAAYAEPTAEALAAVVAQLLDDEQAVNQLRERALERVRDLTWSRQYDRLIDMLSDSEHASS